MSREPYQRVVRRSPVENIGIDVHELKPQALEGILLKVEEAVRSSLSKRLGRSDEYSIVVDARIDKEVTIAIDLYVESPVEIPVEVEAMLEEAIDQAFKVVRDELRKFSPSKIKGL